MVPARVRIYIYIHTFVQIGFLSPIHIIHVSPGEAPVEPIAVDESRLIDLCPAEQKRRGNELLSLLSEPWVGKGLDGKGGEAKRELDNLYIQLYTCISMLYIYIYISYISYQGMFRLSKMGEVYPSSPWL